MPYSGDLEAVPIPGLKPAKAARSPSEPRSARSRARSKAASPKGRKAKPPCKYGPRGADGYCPKKPRETYRAKDFTPEEPPQPKKPAARKPTRVERRIEQRIERNVELAAKRTAATAAKRAAESKTGIAVAGAVAKTAKYLRTPVGALAGAGAATVAGTLALAATVGIGAFLGTRAVLNRIKNAKERREVEAFERAQAFRLARLRAEAQLGRPLVPSEAKTLYNLFQKGVK